MAFKHPQPEDFFRTMNDAAGDDLNRYWKEWFYETWKLDQSVKSVKYVKDSAAFGYIITIENLAERVMPVKMKVTERNGRVQELQLRVEVWQRGGEWTIKYNSTTPITSVVIDPNNEFPDVNSKNNRWPTGD